LCTTNRLGVLGHSSPIHWSDSNTSRAKISRITAYTIYATFSLQIKRRNRHVLKDPGNGLVFATCFTFSVDTYSGWVSVTTKDATAVKEAGIPTPMPMMQAVNTVLMERTPFTIDDAKEDEEDDEGLFGDATDEEVMDEVGVSPPKSCMSSY
jgi:serine/threonine-protein kinase RIO1